MEKFAGRFNSFVLKGDADVYDAIERFKNMKGITHLEFNYPEHFKKCNAEKILERMGHLKVNGVAIRFKPPIFLNGELSHYEEESRKRAVELCKGAVDTCHRLSGEIVTIWQSYDGFDYPFQIDYRRAWKDMIEAFREVCDYAAAKHIKISIEYKPFEPRNHALIDSIGTTLYAIEKIDRENLGCTLDFCHMLMKFDSPAFGLAIAAADKKILGLHLNDGYGQMDSGMIFGSVNLPLALEFVYYLKKCNYDGVIFFDTFPIREDVSEEISANIRTYQKLSKKIDAYGMEKIGAVIETHDAVSIQKMLGEIFLG